MIGTKNKDSGLLTVLDDTFGILDNLMERDRTSIQSREIGKITFIGKGIARIQGLSSVKFEELIRFPGNKLGIAFNLDQDDIAAVMLDENNNLSAGQEVYRTGRVMEVPVGEALLGRVIDPMGKPLDEQGPIHTQENRPIEREAPGIMERAPVNVPLQTGIQVVDALIPIGRGQRELILGDRQTGKTSIAIDTIINQKDKDVICIYCAIGQQSSAVARVIADLRNYGAMKNCIVVVVSGDDPPGLNFIAPYAATTIAEYFMEQGRNVLVVYDDLTRHARSYRELTLLLRRPPAREAYPGDIFYIHSRLLERSTHLLAGGSLTALPVVETEEQNIAAYIPTNLISITDGQIYLSPRLIQEGILPAVDVGKSVSRVGGKTQLPAYREVAGDLRLSYSQFEELEIFARFGTHLDEDTRKTLERGRRVREVLKQAQYEPMSVPEQIAVLLSVTGGVFDELSIQDISDAKVKVQKAIVEKLPDLCFRILSGEKLKKEEREELLDVARRAINFKKGETEIKGEK
ncbi:MAG: alternate F1F0 ATPase, F1 subunit alpha [Candidatus Methanoperedens sp.]